MALAISSFSTAAPSIDDDVVAFVGHSDSTTNNVGIYLDFGGNLIPLIDRFDTLDGKLIRDLNIGRHSLSGNELAFNVDFLDGTRAMYLATFSAVPEPTAFGLIIGPSLLAASLRRRRRSN